MTTAVRLTHANTTYFVKGIIALEGRKYIGIKVKKA